MRLEKYLADCGVGSRSQCKTYIRQGLVKVNGSVAENGAQKVSGTEEISFQGKALTLAKNLYFMFHKPAGCICATRDNSQKTVLDFFRRFFPKSFSLQDGLTRIRKGCCF